MRINMAWTKIMCKFNKINISLILIMHAYMHSVLFYTVSIGLTAGSNFF